MVFQETMHVKRDDLVGPPKEFSDFEELRKTTRRAHWANLEYSIMPFALKNLGQTIDVLVERIKEYSGIYQLYGLFLDDTQWYTCYVDIWKDPKKCGECHIKLTPRPDITPRPNSAELVYAESQRRG